MNSVAEYIHAVEGPQHVDQNRFARPALEDLMRELHVPGVSVAVMELAVMTNSMSGQAIIDQIRERVERVSEWDSLDEPRALASR
jgi:autonomous glycyl radical cofactor GrcA